MIKKFIIIFLCIGVTMLNSCSKFFFDNDDKNAKARLEQVIEAINCKDKEALKMLFSEKALNDADDFDGSVGDLFNFVQGEIESWEKPSGPTVHASNNYGRKWKEVNSYYYINTDKEKYYFSLRDYPVDTENPDNVGIYMLMVVREEDSLKIYDETLKIVYDKIIENGEEKLVKLSHAGIYIPFE